MLSKKPKESTKEKKENTHRFHHPHGSLRSAEFLFFGFAESFTLASHSATLRLTLAFATAEHCLKREAQVCEAKEIFQLQSN